MARVNMKRAWPAVVAMGLTVAGISVAGPGVSTSAAQPRCTVKAGDPYRGQYYIQSDTSYFCTGPVKNVKVTSRIMVRWFGVWQTTGDNHTRTSSIGYVPREKYGSQTPVMAAMLGAGCTTYLTRISLSYNAMNGAPLGADHFSRQLNLRSNGSRC